jgi:outer membrane protein OmpA-like peptidoglycan-associated protein
MVAVLAIIALIVVAHQLHPPAPPAPAPVAALPPAAPPPAAPPAPGAELVVVLPSADGHVGTVVVESQGRRTVLNQPYAASRIGPDAGPTRLSEQEVKGAFGVALGSIPARPASFLLYFITGTDQLTEESRGALDRMLEELRRRPAPDILVIGHTDRVGSEPDNDRLSLQRAERVRASFVAQGIAPERIQASGRGEREPIVQTADGVDEPKNRRVEINVR